MVHCNKDLFNNPPPPPTPPSSAPITKMRTEIVTGTDIWNQIRICLTIECPVQGSATTRNKRQLATKDSSQQKHLATSDNLQNFKKAAIRKV